MPTSQGSERVNRIASYVEAPDGGTDGVRSLILVFTANQRQVLESFEL